MRPAVHIYFTAQMRELLTSRTLSVSIDRHPDEVYDFVSNPANLPRWAEGLCKSIRKSNGGWIAETLRDPVKIMFAERNDLGVLDHYVTTATGEEVYVPMRVVPNGAGSEVLFTLFRMADMSEEKYAEDAEFVERDLKTLKRLLEAGRNPESS